MNIYIYIIIFTDICIRSIYIYIHLFVYTHGESICDGYVFLNLLTALWYVHTYIHTVLRTYLQYQYGTAYLLQVNLAAQHELYIHEHTQIRETPINQDLQGPLQYKVTLLPKPKMTPGSIRTFGRRLSANKHTMKKQNK